MELPVSFISMFSSYLYFYLYFFAVMTTNEDGALLTCSSYQKSTKISANYTVRLVLGENMKQTNRTEIENFSPPNFQVILNAKNTTAVKDRSDNKMKESTRRVHIWPVAGCNDF